mmetsp:Transcript_71114/g.197537  ORF Transcript_71114/g.197537 Transcript_71114/m.197537 type:complete len:208 (-) Transcript_71114:247-870(-)
MYEASTCSHFPSTLFLDTVGTIGGSAISIVEDRRGSKRFGSLVRQSMYEVFTCFHLPSSFCDTDVVVKAPSVFSVFVRRGSKRLGSAVRQSMYEVSTLHFLPSLPESDGLLPTESSLEGASGGSAAVEFTVAGNSSAPVSSFASGAISAAGSAAVGPAEVGSAAALSLPVSVSEITTPSCCPCNKMSPLNSTRPRFLAAFKVPNKAS